jgi:hypothetical protein
LENFRKTKKKENEIKSVDKTVRERKFDTSFDIVFLFLWKPVSGRDMLFSLIRSIKWAPMNPESPKMK